MKRLLMIAIALITFTATTNAQTFKLGIKGGVNFANLEGNLDRVANIDSRTGFHIGGLLELGFGDNFSIQPEVLYSSQGADVREFDTDIDYLNVPVLAKFKFLKILSFEVGPQFGFAIQEGDENPLTGDFNNLDVSGAAGVSVKISSFFAQARYNFGFTDAYDNIDTKNSTVQLSVGYYIF
ncbi:porin family protein [Aquimarina sp. MMG016]|uniref:porin family protein n=1 Tax=Aquimarina sp. MMG016 TaxID=2822690 RepID=UPI001B39D8E4|nr:porin family protein [Aquimarina sp. MMG016]MBQ4819090.1 PorT family protein [Aquimarina sp. MMG016]